MKWKEFIADYLNFTHRDRIGIIVILAVVLGVFFLPMTISSNSKSKTSNTDTTWMSALKKLEQKEADNDQQYGKYNNDDNSSAYQYDRRTNNSYYKPKGELFSFDPNTLTTDGWKKLGLRDKTIATIQNYLSKGGKFRKPEDLQRIYGLFPNEFERIAPYIKIESVSESDYNSKKYTDKSYPDYQPKKTYSPNYSVIDVNSADANSFIELPGIGSTLSARIISFREKLGGFYSINQVSETFGLPDSTFQMIKQYLKLENISIRKIDINKATVDELKVHPYIRYSLANPIIAYRNQHGAFSKVEDIKKLMVVTDEIYNKIAPYLIIQ